MNENLKTAAQITGKTALQWFLVFIGGIVSTLITFLIAIFSNLKLASGGHGPIAGILFGTIANNIPAFILIVGAPLFLVVYFILANKISIQKAIYLLWKSKMGTFITSKVGVLAENITEKSNWAKEITDKAMLQAKILHLAQSDKTSTKLQRKIINYILSRLNLEDVNFQDEKINLSRILMQKFDQFISETTKPSLLFFWILAGFQVLLLIVSFFI